MSRKISINQKTTLPLENIQKTVDGVFADLTATYSLKGEWQGEKTFVISGQGLTGELAIGDNSINVNITICGVLSAFTPTIESHVKQKLRTHLSIHSK